MDCIINNKAVYTASLQISSVDYNGRDLVLLQHIARSVSKTNSIPL